MLKHRRMCKHHLNTVENIYKNVHPLRIDVYTYSIAYVKRYSALWSLKTGLCQCIFRSADTFEGLISWTPFSLMHSHRGRGKFKGVLLVSFSLHSTRGGLHHRFVTGMTESESHAGGRPRNWLTAGLLGIGVSARY